MTLKYNVVTWEMIWKAFVGGDPVCLNIPEKTKEYYKTMADRLNKLINERCPYCEEGERGCQCWNDE